MPKLPDASVPKTPGERRPSTSSANGFSPVGDRGTPFAEWSAPRKEMAEFFRESARNVGFRLKPLGARSANINGKLCVQRQACCTTQGEANTNILTLVFIGPQVGLISARGNLPDGPLSDSALRKLVGFHAKPPSTRKESERPGTASSSHYYREYIERWSLLGRPPAGSK